MSVVITRTANPAGVTAVSTVATYSNVAIGTAVPNRIVVVNVTSEVASATIVSCTIGGTSMTAGTAGTQGNARTRQFYLLYPTGTTADILVTFGASPTNVQNHISVYTVIDGAFISTNANASTDMDATVPLTTGSQTIASGGGMIAVVCGATDTVAKTWSIAGEDLDVDAGSHRHTTWFSTTAATQTLTCSGTTDGEDGAMSWLIFTDNVSPTVALNTPADATTDVSITPILDFTGTDTDSNDVRYRVQLDTSNAFNSGTIAYGGSTNSGVISATNTTTFNSPSVSGSNTVGWVALNARDATLADTEGLTVTWNGSSMTKASTQKYDTSTPYLGVSLWYIIAPTVGVTSIVVTWTGTIDTGSAIVSYFTGASQRSLDYADASSGAQDIAANATDPSVAVTTITNNCWVIDSVYNKTGSAMTVGTGQTQIAQLAPNAGGDMAGSSYEGPKTPAGSVTMSWTVNPDDDWAITAASFKPVTLIDVVSGTDAGFANPDNGGDTDPFTSGENIQYTVQSALANSTTYYWRVAGIDPSGSNTYGAFSTARSFTTIGSGGTVVKDILGMGFIPFPR